MVVLSHCQFIPNTYGHYGTSTENFTRVDSQKKKKNFLPRPELWLSHKNHFVIAMFLAPLLVGQVTVVTVPVLSLGYRPAVISARGAKQCTSQFSQHPLCALWIGPRPKKCCDNMFHVLSNKRPGFPRPGHCTGIELWKQRYLPFLYLNNMD